MMAYAAISMLLMERNNNIKRPHSHTHSLCVAANKNKATTIITTITLTTKQPATKKKWEDSTNQTNLSAWKRRKTQAQKKNTKRAEFSTSISYFAVIHWILQWFACTCVGFSLSFYIYKLRECFYYMQYSVCLW